MVFDFVYSQQGEGDSIEVRSTFYSSRVQFPTPMLGGSQPRAPAPSGLFWPLQTLHRMAQTHMQKEYQKP